MLNIKHILLLTTIAIIFILGFYAYSIYQPSSSIRIPDQTGIIDTSQTVSITTSPTMAPSERKACPNEPDCNVPPPPGCIKQDPVYDANGCLVKCGTPGC